VTAEGEQTERLVRTFFETLSAGDLEGLAGLLDEHATWTVHARGLPGSGTHAGRHAVIEDFLRPVRGLFRPGDPKVVVEHVLVRGSLAAVEARGEGQLADGTPYDNTYAFFVEVADGKIRAIRESMDSHYVSTLLAGHGG
jgi:ketosteroid isomerase-like protein